MSQNKEGNTYFLLTMDCERVRERDFYPAGPLSWQESERNIMAFGETASAFGYKVTYFAVPEAVEQHADIFKELIKAGHEVGLHLHPHTFRFGINENLGNLPYDMQFEIIKEAKEVFERALGFSPFSFRSGNFSANQDTFLVLEKLGFKRGSSVVPGRNMERSGCNWGEWPRHCQYVNSFFEVPVTVRFISKGAFRFFCVQSLIPLLARGLLVEAARKAIYFSRGNSQFATSGKKFLIDLRIEECEYSTLREIVFTELERMKKMEIFSVLNSLTHSYINYTDDSHRKNEYRRSK